MDIFTELLNKSCQHYQQLHEEIVAAVELAKQSKFEEATISITKVNNLLAEIKIADKKLFSLAEKDKIDSQLELWNKRSDLLKSTLEFHDNNIIHMKSILAMKKDQIQKIRGGRRGLNGYHVGAKETGKLIQNST